MHRNAAHILAVIVGQRNGLAVLAFLGINVCYPGFIFSPVSKPRETRR